MPYFQIILTFVLGTLFTLGVHHLNIALFVRRKDSRYLWFSFTALGGTVYVLFQLLLSFSCTPETALWLHRGKMVGLVITLSSWLYTAYSLYMPDSRIPAVFLAISGVVLFLIPTPLFLDAPVTELEITTAGIRFNYHFGTTGIFYTFYAVCLGLFFPVLTIWKLLRRRTLGIREKLLGIAVVVPVFVALNDFSVTHGLIRGIMLAELSVFGFVVGISVEFFRADAADQQLLRDLNRSLEQQVSVRTRELEEANSKLLQAATTDLLTGLYNRSEFERRLGQEQQRLQRYYGKKHTCFAVAFIDLDNFKYYNDTFGHHAGDLLLTEFAALLRRLVRNTDIAGRFGGDEFVIFLPETDRKGAMQLAERIRRELREKCGYSDLLEETLGYPPRIPEHLRLSCSIGISEYCSGAGADLHEVLRQADRALLSAKNHGKDRFELWGDMDL